MLDEPVQWYLFIGALLVSVAALGPFMVKRWVAPVHLQLLGGIIVGPLCLGLIELDLDRHAKLLEVASEIAVIISLYAAGVKMRIPLSSGRWKAPVLLACVTMVVTILLTAAVAYWLFGISLAAALLIGAVLAPTDPVLADKIQMEHADDDDRLRQSLTGEAGLNDGTAFPFVLLAVGLSDQQLHELGPGLVNWILVDLLWKVTVGLLFGAIAGYVLGKAILKIRSMHDQHEGTEELLTIGLIAIVYGLALALNSYAFLAVFAAAVSLRRIEMMDAVRTGDQGDSERESCQAELLREQTAVGSALERIAQVFLVVVIGVLLTSERFSYWQLWVFALLMICVIRPLAVLTTLRLRSTDATQRYLIAWFGIRGIGTVYYLAHAIALGVDGPLGDELAIIIGCCVTTITLSIAIHGTTDTPMMRWYTARQRKTSPANP